MNRQNERNWALITGASAGIGAEFARQLAARGAHLVLVARRAARLEALAEEMRHRHSVDSRVLAADLADPAAPGRIAAALSAAGIVPSMLVNNAGYGVAGTLTDVDFQVHRDFQQVMVNTVVELTYRLLPGMRSLAGGAVINVASLAGLVPGAAGHTLYAAAKAYLVRFSESLALENEEYGIRVQALCPGFTYSEFHDVVGTRDIVRQMSPRVWMSAEAVVTESLAALDRHPERVVVIPGGINRWLSRLGRWLSPAAAHRLVRKRSRRFRSLTAKKDG